MEKADGRKGWTISVSPDFGTSKGDASHERGKGTEHGTNRSGIRRMKVPKREIPDSAMNRKDCEHMSMAENQLELLPEQMESVVDRIRMIEGVLEDNEDL